MRSISRSLKELSRAKTIVLLQKFERLGQDHPGMHWSEALRRLGLEYRLVTSDLQPVDPSAERVLERAKTAFEGGASRGLARSPRAISVATRKKLAS
jgi:hypothetical protein